MERDTEQDCEETYHACSESGGGFPEQNIRISKVAVQNGKKVTAKVNFEVVTKAPGSVPQPADVSSDDGFREMMERSLRDAIEATKAVNTVQWSVDDIRGIPLTIFIQRARG